MAVDFAIASAVEPVGDNRYQVDIPDGWQQGRGAFGGLVLGTLLRAMERSEPDAARVTRTLSGDLCGPIAPGAAEVRVRVLRRGSNQTNLQAELTQAGSMLALASAVLSPPRTPDARRTLAPPAAERWQDVPVIAVGPPDGPPFARHYEYRGVGAPFVVTGATTIAGWVRERAPLGRLDAPALIGRLDAWWPTLFGLDGKPRPMATISFTAEILGDLRALPPDAPLRYRAHMAAMHDGFLVEMRELWHDDLPLALNQQTFAIIR